MIMQPSLSVALHVQTRTLINGDVPSKTNFGGLRMLSALVCLFVGWPSQVFVVVP
jgi:hypothetical protein